MLNPVLTGQNPPTPSGLPSEHHPLRCSLTQNSRFSGYHIFAAQKWKANAANRHTAVQLFESADSVCRMQRAKDAVKYNDLTLPHSTNPVWIRPILADQQELPTSSSVDVCIIGAGIAGLTTGYQLLKEGRRVILLNDGPLGNGETGRTSAHLASALDDRFVTLEKLHGPAGTRIARESHDKAIDWIEAFVNEEGNDCDFRRVDGYLILKEGDAITTLQEERIAAQRSGFPNIELLSGIPTATGPLSRTTCLRFPRQAEIEPMKYLAMLTRAFLREGGKIYTHAHVESYDDDTLRVHVRGDVTVHCNAIVVATNAPVNNRVSVQLKLAPYRTYAITLKIPKEPHALIWDTEDPYHYVRMVDTDDPNLSFLLVGGEDHKTGQENDGYERWSRLEQWARQYFPDAQEVVHRWSGQILEPADGLAYIGRNPGSSTNVFIATGDSGHGLTHGTIAGILLPALIAGRKHPWEKLYDPHRFKIKALPTFAKEGLDGAAQYAHWLKRSDISDPQRLPCGSGAVLNRGLQRIALYRSDDGEFHSFSAICTHMHGIVSWNPAEKTWDCPCHGSRFDAFGRVLNGPASKNLEPIEFHPDTDQKEKKHNEEQTQNLSEQNREAR